MLCRFHFQLSTVPGPLQCSDRAIARLVELLRAAKQSPLQFFSSMDTDRSGNVAPSELRRALNDAVAAVNDEAYASLAQASSDELGPSADIMPFSQAVRTTLPLNTYSV